MVKRAQQELAGLLEPFFGKPLALSPRPWSRGRGALGGVWRLEAHHDGMVELCHDETGFLLKLSDDCIADAKRIPPTLFLDVAVTIDDGRIELTRLRSLPAPLSQGVITKSLVKVGGSYGVILERPLLDLLAISDDTPLEIATDGERIVIQPRRPVDTHERVRSAAEFVANLYAETFKRLA